MPLSAPTCRQSPQTLPQHALPAPRRTSRLRSATLSALLLALLLPAAALAAESEETPGDAPAAASDTAEADGDAAIERALVIVTSASSETQAMAMILANAMQQQGTALHILLCDAAGHLAVEGYESPQAVATPPANPAGAIRPEMLLAGLQSRGATVEVCAIFLPNTDRDSDDLREGVGVAAPGPIAQQMRAAHVRTFTF